MHIYSRKPIPTITLTAPTLNSLKPTRTLGVFISKLYNTRTTDKLEVIQQSYFKQALALPNSTKRSIPP